MMMGVGFIALHCSVLLVRCKRTLLSRNVDVTTFGDLAHYLIGRNGARVVDALLMFTQFGFCCVYVVFCAESTQYYIPSVPWQLLVVIWYPIFVGLSWIRTMKVLRDFCGKSIFRVHVKLLTHFFNWSDTRVCVPRGEYGHNHLAHCDIYCCHIASCGGFIR